VSHVPRLYLGVATLQGALSALALLAALLDSCGSCGGAVPERILVGALGCAGYAALLALGVRGWPRAFSRGIFLAAGVHVALTGAMIARASFCPVCAAAAGVAVLWALHAGRQLRLRSWLSIGAAWAGLLTAGWTLSEAPAAPLSARSSGARLSVVIYENPLCPHCQEFRRSQAPRLEREFPGKLALEYRPSKGVPGIRLTPTVMIEGGSKFEGLGSYAVLAAGVRAAAAKASTPSEAGRVFGRLP
jgi:hypothetical protein